MIYCHNPNNKQKQLKTTYVGMVVKLVKKTTPQPHTMFTTWEVPGNLGS